MAAQALIDAQMKAALPIAQFEVGNKKDIALEVARQRSAFLNLEFTQEQAAKVENAATISEIANLNFTSEQNVALENSRLAQTMNLANLGNSQALVLAEASAIASLDLEGLSNLQQAAVENAKNFLQVDMSNLSNSQSMEILKTQTRANSILNDAAAENVTSQINAASDNQVEQFFATLQSTMSQFNSAQTNAMKQFNAGEVNAIQKFNAEIQDLREKFNAGMSATMAQSNAKWRQDATTINNASANESNFQFAKDVNGLTNKALDILWQRERDRMSFAMTSSENAMNRIMNLLVADKDLEGLKMKLDSEESNAKTSLIGRFLFGSGIGGDTGLFGSFFGGSDEAAE